MQISIQWKMNSKKNTKAKNIEILCETSMPGHNTQHHQCRDITEDRNAHIFGKQTKNKTCSNNYKKLKQKKKTHTNIKNT